MELTWRRGTEQEVELLVSTRMEAMAAMHGVAMTAELAEEIRAYYARALADVGGPDTAARDRDLLAGLVDARPRQVGVLALIVVVRALAGLEVLRAVAADGQGNRSDVVTEVYFVGFQDKAWFYGQDQILSLTVDPEDLLDAARGIYVLGDTWEQWRNSGDYDPDLSAWLIPANYQNHGRDWERPAYLQIFVQGEEAASAQVGIRIHGATTRFYEQKSLNVYTRKEYGTKVISYDLYQGRNTSEASGEPITEYDSFILRNGGQDNVARIREKLIQRMVGRKNYIVQAITPCVVFLNGEFWGQYDISEKLTDDFIHDHFGVLKKNVVLVKNEEIEEGTEEDAAALADLREWIRETDFSSGEAYQRLSDLIDLQGLAEYVSTEFYIANWDFGDNNVALWKAREKDPENAWADGKWRFILFDTEYSTGIFQVATAEMNAIEMLREKDCIIRDFFFGAMENPDFRKLFSEAYEEVSNSDFAFGMTSEVIDELDGFNRELTLATNDRFMPGWEGDVDEEEAMDGEIAMIREFFAERQEYSDEHVAELLAGYE